MLLHPVEMYLSYTAESYQLDNTYKDNCTNKLARGKQNIIFTLLHKRVLLKILSSDKQVKSLVLAKCGSTVKFNTGLGSKGGMVNKLSGFHQILSIVLKNKKRKKKTV